MRTTISIAVFRPAGSSPYMKMAANSSEVAKRST
jgi:hypothetical protein